MCQLSVPRTPEEFAKKQYFFVCVGVYPFNSVVIVSGEQRRD